MNLILLKQLESINVFDIVLAITAIGAGIFSIINPKKAWYLFQSKRNKTNAPTDKMIKSTKYYGIAITILAIIFVFIAFR